MNRIKMLITLVLLVCVMVGNGQHKEVIKVVLLAGQSNMAGAGNFDELDSSIHLRLKKIAERVQLSFNGKPAKPLSSFNNNSSEKYDFNKRFGPEIMIGLLLAEQYPNDGFLLIKRSHGGTALYGAWNPDWSAQKAEAVEKGELKQGLKLYEAHIAHIRTNLESLEQQGKSYEIIGLCWMQGENDAAKEVSARSYYDNLTRLIQSYRQEFNIPNMSFVVGQINSTYGNFPEGPDMVRKAMIDVAQTDADVFCIETKTDRSWSDFPKHADNVHYNTEGQKRLGEAFAKALIGLKK